MRFVSIILISILVPAALNYFMEKAVQRSTSSINHFVMRPVKDMYKLGLLCAIFFGGCMVGAWYADQLELWLGVIFGSFLLLGVLLMIVPLPGFWDVTVDGDEVMSSRIWIIKKKIRIQDIHHCVWNRGGYYIYLKNKKHKAMSIDSMSINLDNWKERMEREGIPIIVKK